METKLNLLIFLIFLSISIRKKQAQKKKLLKKFIVVLFHTCCSSSLSKLYWRRKFNFKIFPKNSVSKKNHHVIFFSIVTIIKWFLWRALNFCYCILHICRTEHNILWIKFVFDKLFQLCLWTNLKVCLYCNFLFFYLVSKFLLHKMFLLCQKLLCYNVH